MNQITDMKWVDGISGANAANVLPGHTDHFFDNKTDHMYVKMVDVSGVPQPLKRYKLTEDPIPESGFDLPDNVVTTEVLDQKFNDFKKDILEAIKQSNQRKPNYNNNRKNRRYEEEGNE